MRQIKILSSMVVATATVLALTTTAPAEDLLKVAVAKRGVWQTAAPELGQRAGIFKKHGIALDLSYPENEDDTEVPVVSGGAELGVGVGIMDALRAYGKGAPLRIVGASMSGSASYWYVAAGSPIKTVKDLKGRSIAYWRNGPSSQYDVFDLMDRYRIKARPVLTAGAVATLDQVMSGHIDVGWATAPFGVDAIEQNRIRMLAKANEIPRVRDKTVDVMIASADTLQQRKDVLTRFLAAYRETVDWMYSDAAALKEFAEFAGVSEGIAQRLRADFITKEMLSPDAILGLKDTLKEAFKAKYLWTPLSKQQVADLIQIPGGKPTRGWLRIFSPRSQ
ncbi:MAG TPA: ABC transporter substrate-binding protein [Xanthobacteraceae bacterium]|jgi:NitT/TauT family transport system substrate-binding protein